MKIISFNANGIRAAARAGFFTWLHEQDVDFVCLQETKAQVNQLLPHDLYHPENYFCEYFDAQKKGYSGVAIYARHKPLTVSKGIGYDFCDHEGRYIQFDYPKLSVISLYLPSGTSGDYRQNIKFAYLERFAEHLLQLKASGRELVLCGDYNIAHKQIDLKNWRANQNRSGFLPAERQWMDKLFADLGFIDAFRLHNQQPEQYTWWSQRSLTAREKNVGWRIDYQVITPGLKEAVVDSKIFRDPRFSDHAPLLIEYKGDWYA